MYKFIRADIHTGRMNKVLVSEVIAVPSDKFFIEFISLGGRIIYSNMSLDAIEFYVMFRRKSQ